LLLDKIRKTSVQARETGGITQHIGASFFPSEIIKQLCGPYLSTIKGELEIPGLLIIDTPGHEAFANLRKRGGSVADIAILVIDILRGFEAQTHESLEILKARKTPFLVATNKIDRIPGWDSRKDKLFARSYKLQSDYIKQDLDSRIYEIIGTFSRLGFRADRYDNIKDFTKTIAIVPTSAKTGEGITDLLSVLVGLTQQYLKKRLQTTKGPAKGTVLEVKEEPGLGLTINTIIYDGVLKKDNLIIVGGKEHPIITPIRAILIPKPLDEIRDPRDKFSSVKSVHAAAGVKIVAPDLEGALAGAPLYAIPKNEVPEKYAQLIFQEIENIRIVSQSTGIILKADTLGSLEAISASLKNSNVPVRLADVGDVSKRDIIEAKVVMENDQLYGVVLAFNVKILPDAAEEANIRDVQVFEEKIIYHLIDNYLQWLKSQRELKLKQSLDKLIMPGKLQVLEGFIFRKAKPAIFGVEILAGRVKTHNSLIKKDGSEIGEIQQIQDKGKSLSVANQGTQVAISMDKPIIGRHVFEKDILYVKLPESHVKELLTKYLDSLTLEEQNVLNEYIAFMRTKIPFWAL
jgi:translation initiation factor 5B